MGKAQAAAGAARGRGVASLEQYLEKNPTEAIAVSVETAHPAKFPEEIEQLLGFSPKAPATLADVESKPEQYQKMPPDYAAFKRLLLETYG